MTRIRTAVLLLLLVASPWLPQARAYSLLTHEQLVNLVWKDSVVPFLLSRYPNLTAAQIDEARAYAYGGCVIQDIGYYPFGDRNFSNLTHYVRSGDFVLNLFRNAHDANELAFAIGALSHYVGDSVGHSMATNRAVPVEFPHLEEKFGSVVNYAEGPHQHVQTEFAFDIYEIAHHRMAPVHFYRHVGLKVPLKQLALAYYQTYGLTVNFARKRSIINVRAYRFAVHGFIPRIAYAITLLHRRHEPEEPQTKDLATLDKQIAELATENNWAHYRRHAGIGTYMLAGFLWILPKVGPLKLVAVKGPTTATEGDYLHSVEISTRVLQRTLAGFTPNSASAMARANRVLAQLAPSNVATNRNMLLLSRDRLHPLPNRDLDTGRVVQPGGYPLTDATYAGLLHSIVAEPKQSIPPGIKRDIEAYYSNPDAPITTKKDEGAWKEVQADLATLAGMKTSTEPEPYPTYGDDAESMGQE
ncbi:MAG: zinc dependent phospholipase C family protein [Acidobacteriota bacterium]|nr:zinc dependent phospholipase C family protein [Acidobacteriota bacterium]